MRGRFASMCFFEVFSLQTYTAGVVIFFTTSRVNVLPSRSCTVSWNTIESPVIFTTYPLNTGSFSRKKYALFRLLLTTAMKPLSACTTPRKLIAPISRHFLPVLQPEPPAWLTTGLMKGSRLPFALFLLVSTACSSAWAPSFCGVAAWLAATGVSSLGAAVGAGCALCPTKTAPPRLACSLRFASVECACAGDADAETFAGAATAVPPGLAEACLALAVAGAGLRMPTASFEAAVGLPLAALMLARVFWITLGLWAEAIPAASTETRIVVVIVMAGFVFILSLLFLHRRPGLAVRRRRCQVMTEIRGRQTSRHHTLTGCVLVGLLRLCGGWSVRRGHQQVRHVDDALHFSQPVEESQHRVVRTVELYFERHFGVKVFRSVWTGRIAPHLHSRLARFSAYQAHEIVHFLFIGHDAPLDFHLLFQARQLALDVGQFRPVGFQFRVLAKLGLQRGPGRRILIVLRLVDRVVEAASHQHRHQQQNSQQLHTCQFAKIHSRFRLYDFAFSQVSVN